MAAARRLLPLLLPLAWARPAGCADPPDGGWLAGTVPEEERCTVERADASLTYSLFLQRFAFSRPLILRGVTDNSAFRALCTREKLLAAFGALPVRLSTANTYSYRKVDVPFQEYVEQLLTPQDPARLGNAVRAPPVPHPGHQPCLQLRGRRLRLRRPLPLARPRLLRGDLRQEDHAGLAPPHVPRAAAGRAAAGVHPAPRGGPVLPGPLVARHAQPGHQRLHLHLPGVEPGRTRTCHHCPARGGSSCHHQRRAAPAAAHSATGVGTKCLKTFWFLLVFFPPPWIKVVLL
ncbi:jmjC domain-containing protein 8 isoform X1 [Nyctibius grandis]|uniref:jmjC domain-containing protein 8 isoform X1 n=1 Tax=Nyctibius grandis TaxID=48427 RepID=UPI0035BBDDA5